MCLLALARVNVSLCNRDCVASGSEFEHGKNTDAAVSKQNIYETLKSVALHCFSWPHGQHACLTSSYSSCAFVFLVARALLRLVRLYVRHARQHNTLQHNITYNTIQETHHYARRGERFEKRNILLSTLSRCFICIVVPSIFVYLVECYTDRGEICGWISTQTYTTALWAVSICGG